VGCCVRHARIPGRLSLIFLIVSVVAAHASRVSTRNPPRLYPAHLRAHEHIPASFETLLSLNLAFAFSYGITMYNLTQVAYSKGTSDGYAFVYYFLRSAVGINNLLHLRSSNPVYGRLRTFATAHREWAVY
jgi:hypothetical protein